MKKLALAAVIACASLIGGTANAGQACMTVGGSFTKSCRDIIVSGPGCASRSSTSWIYGYEVRAACLVGTGGGKQYKNVLPYPISTNDGNGGGTPKIQTQTCRELEHVNGFLKCTKS